MAQLNDPYIAYKQPIIDMVNTLKPERVLEIGIGHHAFSTQIFLSLGCELTTIDKGDWGGFAERLKGPKFTFIEERSEIAMPQLAQEGKKYDLIYIDGDHAYAGAKADMLNAIPLLADNGVIVLDDYGVDFISAVDIVGGRVVDGLFGVKQAADEVFTDGWEELPNNFNLANGGKVYKKCQSSLIAGVGTTISTASSPLTSTTKKPTSKPTSRISPTKRARSKK